MTSDPRQADLSDIETVPEHLPPNPVAVDQVPPPPGPGQKLAESIDALLAQLRAAVLTATKPGTDKRVKGFALAGIRDLVNRLAPLRELATSYDLTAAVGRIDIEAARAAAVLKP